MVGFSVPVLFPADGNCDVQSFLVCAGQFVVHKSKVTFHVIFSPASLNVMTPHDILMICLCSAEGKRSKGFTEEKTKFQVAWRWQICGLIVFSDKYYFRYITVFTVPLHRVLYSDDSRLHTSCCFPTLGQAGVIGEPYPITLRCSLCVCFSLKTSNSHRQTTNKKQKVGLTQHISSYLFISAGAFVRSV